MVEGGVFGEVASVLEPFLVVVGGFFLGEGGVFDGGGAFFYPEDVGVGFFVGLSHSFGGVVADCPSPAVVVEFFVSCDCPVEDAGEFGLEEGGEVGGAVGGWDGVGFEGEAAGEEPVGVVCPTAGEGVAGEEVACGGVEADCDLGAHFADAEAVEAAGYHFEYAGFFHLFDGDVGDDVGEDA